MKAGFGKIEEKHVLVRKGEKYERKAWAPAQVGWRVDQAHFSQGKVGVRTSVRWHVLPSRTGPYGLN